MNSLTEPARQTPVAGSYDVIVAGAGTAGIFAAIASARNGARTLLLERMGFMGGHIATQLLEHSAGWFDAKGDPIVGGLPEELCRRLVEANASPGHVSDDTGYTKFRLPVDHEAFKSVITGWLAEEGVDFLVYSPVVSLLETDEGPALIVENKSGRQAYLAKALVDCTGDADICALGGSQFLSRPGDITQPVSILFKIGGIDHEVLLDYVCANPDQFKLGVDPRTLYGQRFVNLWGFGDILAKGYAEGLLSLERAEFHYAGETTTGEAVINATRVAADATDALSLSRAEAVLRKQVLEFVAFFRKYLPGGANAHLVATAACVGIRESRRIKGMSVLTDEDVRSARRFDDAICRGGFPIDSHDAQGKSMAEAEHVPSGYDIPLSCLIPSTGSNVIVAGRCISAERRALASARITGTCMAMGQAAGTAAALAAGAGVPLRALDAELVRTTLRAQGALLL